ncbi:hypothetical protein GCK32_011563 [Trichostrongylus colubriformis]|uniref:Uncharacterized protein n=1 Tax=Trichostrongylus colubriformis TaxID=6319 RepID=A0AAN8GAY5_TRICO
MENMKKTAREGFFKGDPIWNIYKRHGGKTGCLYWLGCSHNISGSRPDMSPKYRKGIPFRDRFDTILEWLLLPGTSRPGLITAYLDQPDTAGHFHADVGNELAQLDDDLRYLIQRLDAEDLLPCINLVLVSDHGMHKLSNIQHFSDFLTDRDVLPTAGVNGRVYKYKSNATVDELMKPFACEEGRRWKVFSRSSMPTRKHYQKTARIGDVIVQGEPGTSFCTWPSQGWMSWLVHKSYHSFCELTGDHGYDFINPTMQTVFFAMGPSIKKGVVIPGFQNIEYLNLFLSLLGLPENVPNNGTVGLLDGILTHPPNRSSLHHPFPLLQECSASGIPVASSCRSCSLKVLDPISAKLMCPKPEQVPFQILSKPIQCSQNYCGNTLIIDRETNAPVGISEILTRGVNRFKEFCYTLNSEYGGLCSNHTDREGLTLRSLSAVAELSGNDTERIPWKSKFITDVLDPLNEYTRSLAQRMGRLISITGMAYDFDYDGIADERQL